MTVTTYDLVIVGGGAAGLNAAAAARARFPGKRVLLIDGEEEIGYYRTLLPMFMTGVMPEEKLFFQRPDDPVGYETRLGVRALALDREQNHLSLGNGEVVGYERLILAQGGRPILPPMFADRRLPAGSFPVRSLTVARRIKDWLPEHRRIVVLGGGLVGSKTSVFLAMGGCQVTLVEREPHILPTVLSERTAAPLQRHIANLGIDIRVNATIDEIETEGDKVARARLSTGEWLPCETLLIGIGGTPDIGFLADSDLIDGEELVVNPGLQTRDPNIFAIGDAVTIETAEGEHHQPWTWPQAVSQGKRAGDNAFRPSAAPVPRVTRVNAQNISGIPLMILGGPGVGSEVVSRPDPDPGVWREFFMEADRIVGGALVGDIAGAGPLHFRMANGEAVGGEAPQHLQRRTRAFAAESWGRLARARRARRFAMEGERA